MNNSKQPEKLVQKTDHKLRRHSARKKWLIIGIILAVLLGGAASSWFFILNKQSSTSPEAIAKQQAKRAEVVNKTNNDAQKVVDSGGKVSDVAVIYDNAIKLTDDSQAKSDLLFNKAITFYNNGDNDEALSVAKDLEMNLKNEDIERFIAEIYVKKGDNKNAIQYYQKALVLVDSSSDFPDFSADYYTNKIAELKVMDN